MRGAAFLATFLLAFTVLPAPGGQASAGAFTADGHTGFLAAPPRAPLGIVVVVHGYGHPASDHIGHLEHLAGAGYVALAMDFGGSLSGFPLRSGADATVAGTRAAVAAHPGVPVYLYSVSMGTAVSSMVLAEMPGTFSYWVDNEGLSQLAETWTEASALAPANAFAKTASDAITAECGGSPVEQPACYQERSAVLRAPEFVGLQGVVLTHGLNDGLVPYDQGREMEAALKAIGVPTDFYTVVRDAGGEGTTVTGYASHDLDNGFSGHGTESEDGDTLTALSFDLLDQVLGGYRPADREFVLESDVGTLP